MSSLQSLSSLVGIGHMDFINPLIPILKKSTFSNNQKKFKKNDYIYLPEEKSNEIYLLTKGRVSIGRINDEGKEMIKTIIRKDEIFGELSLAGELKRIDFALAMEETIVNTISIGEMKRLMKRHQALNFYILKIMGLRLMDMEKRLEALIFKNSRTRVIEYLAALARKKGQRIGYEVLVRKFFTHQEIASLTATSRQTVTTVLNDLRKKNILTFNRRRLLIRDLDLLKAETFSI